MRVQFFSLSQHIWNETYTKTRTVKTINVITQQKQRETKVSSGRDGLGRSVTTFLLMLFAKPFLCHLFCFRSNFSSRLTLCAAYQTLTLEVAVDRGDETLVWLGRKIFLPSMLSLKLTMFL